MSEQTPTLPLDHSDRMARARLSLNGLSVGDADTNCAIVGGIVALSTGRAAIPREWIDRCEIHSGLAE